uniref:Uncharacterized protein n=1 Tax=Myotis myotis TaxID=51298 RepID=A0A7J7UCZ0_MYOMY|nr:hypothetical protein mMyoMyo1_008783 [Myotis myotis]
MQAYSGCPQTIGLVCKQSVSCGCGTEISLGVGVGGSRGGESWSLFPEAAHVPSHTFHELLGPLSSPCLCPHILEHQSLESFSHLEPTLPPATAFQPPLLPSFSAFKGSSAYTQIIPDNPPSSSLVINNLDSILSPL